MQSSNPQWDEFFAFELVSPAFAVLKVKVMDHMHCWRPQMLGEVRSRLLPSLMPAVDARTGGSCVCVFL